MTAIESIYREDCIQAGVVAFYDNLIRKGSTPQFAAMLALRQPPGTRATERAFLEGQVIHHGFDGAPAWYAERMITKAQKAGINVTGKVYRSQLADQRGAADPGAWVGGVDDFVDSCKRKGLNCPTFGYVHPTDGKPVEDIPLSDKAISEFMPKYRMENPKADVRELREAIIENHGKPATLKNKPSGRCIKDLFPKHETDNV